MNYIYKITSLLILLCFSCTIFAQTDNISRKRSQKESVVQKPSGVKPQQKSDRKVQSIASKTASVSQPTGYVNDHGYVDLGLSVRWATMNVGAKAPSDYGGYYAWGETKTKARYDRDNCFDCYYISDANFTHNIYKRDGQTNIIPTSGHDAARENWGGTWRMPTDIELDELSKYCKWTYTTLNGQKGCKITGPNGNSIFLPACGTIFEGKIYYIGECGDYWSSSLFLDKESIVKSSRCANQLHFYRTNNRQVQLSWRCYGCCVRPVTD